MSLSSLDDVTHCRPHVTLLGWHICIAGIRSILVNHQITRVTFEVVLLFWCRLYETLEQVKSSPLLVLNNVIS